MTTAKGFERIVIRNLMILGLSVVRPSRFQITHCAKFKAQEARRNNAHSGGATSIKQDTWRSNLVTKINPIFDRPIFRRIPEKLSSLLVQVIFGRKKRATLLFCICSRGYWLWKEVSDRREPVATKLRTCFPQLGAAVSMMLATPMGCLDLT